MMVLFLDIDGTILDDNYQIGYRDFKAVAKIKEKNRIILVSARKPSATRLILDQLKIKEEIIVCYNGALILKNGEIVYERILHSETVKKVYKIARDYDASFSVYYGDSWTTFQRDRYVDLESHIVNETPEVVLCLPDGVRAHKLLIICAHQQEKHIFESLSYIPKIISTKSKEGYIEITDYKASKENAFFRVLDLENVPIKETIAIGDGINDKALLKEAGIGVAMENAIEEVKQNANYVTLSNNDNGVAFAINNYIKNF